ncbi:MAG TPA: RNA methyltransferase [Bacilli bacterium]|nr:RNA methyltransferase [Bacilli bacterium]
MENIVSLDNKKVINWTKLQDKKYRDQNLKFLIEGEHLLLEALKNHVVEEIIVTDEKVYDENIPHYNVPEKIMKKLSSLKTPPKVIAICQKLEEGLLTEKIILLDGIQNPGNLGTIIRSALAFNFKTIVLGNNTVDIYNEKVIRATEGMIFNVNVLKRNLKDFIYELKQKEYVIVGTDVKKGIDPKKTKNTKIALIVGNEGQGLDNELNNLCDKLVNIKMNSACESLNVGVAASILMYELGD